MSALARPCGPNMCRRVTLPFAHGAQSSCHFFICCLSPERALWGRARCCCSFVKSAALQRLSVSQLRSTCPLAALLLLASPGRWTAGLGLSSLAGEEATCVDTDGAGRLPGWAAPQVCPDTW